MDANCCVLSPYQGSCVASTLGGAFGGCGADEQAVRITMASVTTTTGNCMDSEYPMNGRPISDYSPGTT